MKAKAMRNFKFKIWLAFAILTTHASVQAATEYIRLEGFANIAPVDYLNLSGTPIESAESGFQFHYLDFQIDTEGYPDPPFDGSDREFPIVQVGGTYQAANLHASASFDASSHIYRSISMQGGFEFQEYIDCNIDPPPQCANPLEFDSVVGSMFDLLYIGFYTIGYFELTYRDSTPPPPIPIPATFWLLASALLGTFGLHKKMPLE